MNTDLDVDIDWDIDEDLDNTKQHYVVLGPGECNPPGTILVAVCGALFRANGRLFPRDGVPNACPGCRASDHQLR